MHTTVPHCEHLRNHNWEKQLTRLLKYNQAVSAQYKHQHIESEFIDIWSSVSKMTQISLLLIPPWGPTQPTAHTVGVARQALSQTPCSQDFAPNTESNPDSVSLRLAQFEEVWSTGACSSLQQLVTSSSPDWQVDPLLSGRSRLEHATSVMRWSWVWGTGRSLQPSWSPSRLVCWPK